MKLKWFAILLAIVLMVVPVTTASSAETDIVDTAIAAGSFTTLVAAVQKAGLVEYSFVSCGSSKSFVY